MAEVAIAFVGFMGAGKSDAARAAAERLGEPAVDADDEIERELGAPIASFFEREGEAAFREREQTLALELLARGGVVSLGGGAVESPPVREALRRHVAVWCRVDERVAWERATATDRPLAVDREAFARRYSERQPLYEEVSRVVLTEGGADAGRVAAPWLAALRRRPEVRISWARSASGEYPAAVGPGASALLDDPRLADALPASRWFAIADVEALRNHGDLLPACEAVIEVEARGGAKDARRGGARAARARRRGRSPRRRCDRVRRRDGR